MSFKCCAKGEHGKNKTKQKSADISYFILLSVRFVFILFYLYSILFQYYAIVKGQSRYPLINITDIPS